MSTNETFTVTLSNAMNAGVTTSTTTGTITDNDAAPALSFKQGESADEDAGNIEFTVDLNSESGRTVEVNYATVTGGGTAQAADFGAASGKLTLCGYRRVTSLGKSYLEAIS